MPSNIDATKPVTGNPTTQSMRDNFSAAKSEIETLQTNVSTAQTTANAKASVAGDLSGSATSPTVARLQGRSMANTAPTTGQPLVWNGTAWAPGSSGATGNYLPLTGGAMTGPIQFGPFTYSPRIQNSSQTGAYSEGISVPGSLLVGLPPDYNTESYAHRWNQLYSISATFGTGYQEFLLTEQWPSNGWLAGIHLQVRKKYYDASPYNSGADLIFYGTNATTGTGSPDDWSVRIGCKSYYDPGFVYGTNLGELEVRGDAIKLGGGSWSAPSDGRLKTNVEPYEAGLSEICQLNPISYRYNGRGGIKEAGPFVGLAAEEAKAVMPEIVSSYRGKIDYDDPEESNILMLDPSALTYATLNALKELNRRLKALEEKAKDE